ncbi:MAG TPA: AmmeMemoRadiSam system radical SAM enzyme [Candidatus Coatesbacteria bacterium]|nr:AmmeMemoRadiSam system radical SAM enzyme [Candidatus Coatesbacteria bacterium]
METPKARYWERLADDAVRCTLCPQRCHIAPGKRGVCRLRENSGGELLAAAYGRTIALNLDPVEKKPLYHFHPGWGILSVGPNGCNLACRFCQNYASSQLEASTSYIAPEELARMADRPGCRGVAFTYTEPLVWFEYVMDAARAVKARSGVTVCVSNAYLEPEPFEELLEVIDAFNFDLKSMDPAFYRELCRGELEPVLATIERALDSPAHVEITNLLVPGENDSPVRVRELAAWLAERSPRTPLHLSRYHPAWRFSTPPTPEETLLRAWRTAKEAGLEYVYLGNVYAEAKYTDTRCPKCGAVLVRRSGYRVEVAALSGEKCSACGAKADFVNP